MRTPRRALVEWIGRAAVIFLLVTASPAAAHAAAGAKSDAAYPPLLTAVEVSVGKLRAIGSRDATMIDEAFAPGASNPVFQWRLPDVKDRTEAAALWSVFFRTAQVFLGAGASPRPVAGFYSPIFDYWLLCYWEAGDAYPHLVETALLPAEMLAGTVKGDALDDRPAWLRLARTIPFSTALQRQAGAAGDAFAQRYPLSAPEPARGVADHAPAIREVFRNRAIAFVIGTSRLREDTQAFALYRATLDALSKGDRQALLGLATTAGAAGEIEAILRVPADHRQSMVPAVSVSTPNGVFVLSNQRDESRFFLITQYGANVGAFGLAGIGLLDAYGGRSK